MHPFEHYHQIILNIYWDYTNEINSFRLKVQRSEELIQEYENKLNNTQLSNFDKRYYQNMLISERILKDQYTISIIKLRAQKKRLGGILIA